jgi:Ca-activated chloride channel family protein
MMSILQQVFAYPLCLLLLAMLPLMGVMAFLAARRRRRTLARFSAPSLLKGLALNGGRIQLLRRLCLAGGLVLLITAIAGPQWGRDWEQSTAPGRDLVVVLDLSRSMLAEDVLPNRVERARQALRQLSYAIQERGGHRLALVAFAARARLVCPLTHDYDHFRAALAELDAANLPPDLRPKGPDAVSGTRIGAGLRTAVDAHDPRFRGYQDILLISDGDDPAQDEEWREGVEAAFRAGIPVHTVGVGNPNVASPIPLAGGGPLRHQGEVVLTKLEEQPLRAIAEGTHGTYTPARTDRLPLAELFRTCIEPRPTHDNPDDALPLYRQRYPWFLGAALLFLALEMVFTPLARKIRASASVGGHRSDDSLNEGADTARAPFRVLIERRSLATGTNADSGPDRFPASFLLLPLLLGAVSIGQAEDFLRRGNAEYAQADFAAAVDWYNRAEESAADPGLVACNEAAALYRLGRFREAELHYRYAREEATGVRLARLLYSLGNCIVQQAQDRDAPRLREAIRFYELCMQQKAADAALVADARHNLELARLLWLKAKAARPGGEPNNPDQGNEDDQPRDPDDTGLRGDPLRALDGRGRSEPLSGVQPDRGSTPNDTDQPPPPGKGNLPTLPDTDDLAPLSPEDAAEHLKEAAARIARERQEHARVMTPAIPSNVKDW